MNNIKKSIIQSQKKVDTSTVSFNTNGGTSLDPLVVATGNTIPKYRYDSIVPTKDSAIFKEWYTDVSLLNNWNLLSDTVVADQTLYADYTDVNLLYTIENPVPSDSTLNDYFGLSVSTYGNKTAVGFPWKESDSGNLYSGAVYVYDNTTGSLLFSIDNPNIIGGERDDFFGTDVYISESFLAVSAHATNTTGKVYVFNNTTGNLMYYKQDPVDSLYFGNSIYMDDSKLIVGSAYYKTTGIREHTGRVYVYSSATGTLLHTFENPNIYGDFTGYLDYFGNRVTSDGNHIAISARESGNIGAVYVYDYNDYSSVRTIENPLNNPGDYFGNGLSVNNGYIVIGAPNVNNGTQNKSGLMYIYKISDGSLVRTIENPNIYGTSESDRFAESIVMTDIYTFASSQYEESTGGGIVYIFNTSTGSLLTTIDNPNSFITNYDGFGNSLSFSGNKLIVSAPSEGHADNIDAGVVYIYEIGDPTPAPAALYEYYETVTSSNFITGDALASSLSLTSGTSINSNTNWMKFLYNGKVVYVAQKPIRYNISWNDINSVDAIDGTAIVTIGANNYKVRLLAGATSDPVDTSIVGNEAILSEWNRLMLPIRVEAPSSFGSSSTILQPTEDWGLDMVYSDFIDIDANGALIYGTWELTKTQSTNSQYVIARYVKTAQSVYLDKTVTSYGSIFGSPTNLDNKLLWRPVLELIE